MCTRMAIKRTIKSIHTDKASIYIHQLICKKDNANQVCNKKKKTISNLRIKIKHKQLIKNKKLKYNPKIKKKTLNERNNEEKKKQKKQKHTGKKNIKNINILF